MGNNLWGNNLWGNNLRVNNLRGYWGNCRKFGRRMESGEEWEGWSGEVLCRVVGP